jgi:Spy/CpxP family protein refolding chaperone
MHPGFHQWWQSAREAYGEESRAGCGPGGGRSRGRHRHEEGFAAASEFGDGGAFGVRRPLRFLAHKLDLDEPQVAQLAKIIDELKTERAQAEVDGRRTIASFADAIASATFDAAKTTEAANARVKSAETLKAAVVTALGRIHALLSAEQREQLAYLIRTGALSI